MSLNCLTSQLTRTDSGNDDDKVKFGVCLGVIGRVDRTWSGNLVATPSYEFLRSRSNLGPKAKKVIKKPSNFVTRPLGVTAAVEDKFGGQINPRLVRSSGTRMSGKPYLPEGIGALRISGKESRDDTTTRQKWPILA